MVMVCYTKCVCIYIVGILAALMVDLAVMSCQAVRCGEFSATAGLRAFVFFDVGMVSLLVLVEVALLRKAVRALRAYVISLAEVDVFLMLG